VSDNELVISACLSRTGDSDNNELVISLCLSRKGNSENNGYNGYSQGLTFSQVVWLIGC
jgi:hypothetical protein